MLSFFVLPLVENDRYEEQVRLAVYREIPMSYTMTLSPSEFDELVFHILKIQQEEHERMMKEKARGSG